VSAAALRLGTRRSLLARTQSEGVAGALRERAGVAVELVEVVTRGDVSRAPLSTIGGTGVFVSALREALHEGRVDLAVHSLKDLPTAPAAGLALAAVPVREDPRDVLVARGGARLADLPAGARVGTGSPRRAAQLRWLRPDLRVVDVRGNVDTRLRLVFDGQLDAVVLARSGLLRLGRAGEVTQVLDPEEILPAPGQGALAVECRADDAATLAACAVLDDAATRAAVTAERALLRALEAGCTAPVGALASAGADGLLHLRALVASPDGGTRLARTAASAPAGAAALGRDVAAALLADGAGALTSLTTTLPARAAGAPPTTGSANRSTDDSPASDPDHQQDETAATAPPERVHP
jgi:hydroxymethylbilane synthase